MLHIILFQPEIPPNTGNIIRLCANSGCQLHLIAPLGFELNDKHLKRAGLDYHEYAEVKIHDSLETCIQSVEFNRIYACTTKTKQAYHDVFFQPGDALLFGPETRGLPDDVLATFDKTHQIRIPMKPNSRSLNLSNAVAVIVYEALRQQHFRGLN